MNSKNWEIIKDDTRRTFEVCNLQVNNNYFTNQIQAMMRMGMNVSYVIQPITNRTSSKERVTITGYQREDGLYERLLKIYQDKLRASYPPDEE